ncbi:MAG: tRNA (cytidine(56)-2'-O)-methyltransferase [Candidatus Altiarchaeales archaeon]|nr:tRNA (cytidine(56)-2'-O)-methyltransferase [Candidatus Altiarchaeales archaeon]MBD3415758.1 tRNA (cytidine(56)-2'-O)-methyltransferase [Candidatus Altiarchaeales archaeon]
MNASVLRLGHRHSRDKRISTHVALTARAFGASRIVYDGRAVDVKESVDEITSSWGGDFKVEFTEGYRDFINSFEGLKVHLTMYGLPLDDVVADFGLEGDILVVVGGAKVPSDVFELVDYNVAVGNQPHSEVAALAVFLDRIFGGGELDRDFKGRMRIVPQNRGKKVLEG